jgi:hypothetical protein
VNLVVDGGFGVIWKRFGGVLAGYWGVPRDRGVRSELRLGSGDVGAYLVWMNKSSRLNPCLS